MPFLCAQSHRSWGGADLGTFAHIRDLLAPLHDALFMETNPVPLKAGLELLQVSSAELRLPLSCAQRATWERHSALLLRVSSAEQALHPRKADGLAA